MGLWANTADGWGSDPSSSGNGALASYLQSSNASAPKSNSDAQVSDPSTSTPTSSIARTVQPSVSKLAYGVTGGLAAPPTALQTYAPQALATALVPSTSLAAVPTVSRVLAGTGVAQAATTPAVTVPATTLAPDTPVASTTAAPTTTGVTANIAPGATNVVGGTSSGLTAPVAAPVKSSYTGPTIYQQQGLSPDGKHPATIYFRIDPQTLQPIVIGYNAWGYEAGTDNSGSTKHYAQGLTDVNGVAYNSDTITASQMALVNQIRGAISSGNIGTLAGSFTGLNTAANMAAVKGQFDDLLNPSRATDLQARQKASSDQATALKNYYLQILQSGGTLPAQGARGDLSLDKSDDTARAAAQAEYQTNKQSALAIGRGITPVDTSTQDAANNAAMAALSSRFSTNLSGSSIGAMSRAFANAVGVQEGTNKQLSDEDYADRFNQNMSAFNQAVQNQSTLDANATGTKLQSDVQAIGDSVQNLSQQVAQLNTQAGQKVNAQLQALQKQINDYNVALKTQAADNSTMVAWAKGIIGAAAAITAIVAAPVTGGASLAAGAALIASG